MLIFAIWDTSNIFNSIQFYFFNVVISLIDSPLVDYCNLEKNISDHLLIVFKFSISFFFVCFLNISIWDKVMLQSPIIILHLNFLFVICQILLYMF